MAYMAYATLPPSCCSYFGDSVGWPDTGKKATMLYQAGPLLLPKVFHQSTCFSPLDFQEQTTPSRYRLTNVDHTSLGKEKFSVGSPISIIFPRRGKKKHSNGDLPRGDHRRRSTVGSWALGRIVEIAPGKPQRIGQCLIAIWRLVFLW